MKLLALLGSGIFRCSVILVFAATLLAPGPAPAAPTVSAPFPLAVTAAKELALSAAFDGTNWLVGIRGEALDDSAITAQLVSPSGDLVGGRTAIGTAGGFPVVAFDGTNHLAVWEADAGGVFGQFIGTNGALVGGPFGIAGSGATVNMAPGLAFGGGYYLVTYFRFAAGDVRMLYGRTISPSGTLGGEMTISADFHKDGGNAAFDGTNFLVVWTAANNATHKGRLVNPDGTLGTEFIVNDSGALSDDPSTVAFDGTEYLVVWMDQGGTSDWDLYGQKISTAGTLLGGVTAITEEPGAQFLGGIAFDGTNWLVVWSDLSNDNGDSLCAAGEGTCQDVYGQVLSQEGALVGSKFPISVAAGNQFAGAVGFAEGTLFSLLNYPEALFGGVFGDVYGVTITPESNSPTVDSTLLPIATTKAMELALSASFDGTNYLVPIGDFTGSGTVTAQLVSGWGARVGPRISTGRTGGDTTVAFDGSRHLMVWKGAASKLYGQFVKMNGARAGTPFVIAGVDENGGLSYGGGSYLATYYRDPDHSSQLVLMGRTISASGTLGAEFRIFDGRTKDDNAIAFDGTNFLVVFCDHTDDANTTIRGRFVSPSGVLGNEIVVDDSPAPSDNPNSVAFDGTNYLVTWMDEVEDRNWDLFGRLVTPAGTFPAPRFTISDAPGTQFMPLAAAGGGHWLITWNDWSNDADLDMLCEAGEGTCWEVYGRYFDPDGTPDGAAFGIGAGPHNQFGGVGGYAAGKFFVIVDDLGDTGFDGLTTDVYGAFVSRDGGIPTVSLVTTGDTATESPLATGTFTVSRTGATTDNLAVRYSVSGTATNRKDYSLFPAPLGTVTIPAGSASATITVTPVNDRVPEPTETVTATLGAGTGYLPVTPGSDVVLIPMNDTITLAKALDSRLVWSTGGDAPWFGQKTMRHDGVDAARPDVLGHGQSSWLQTTVVGPGKIVFYWRTSSEPADRLSVLVDDTLKASRSGVGPWQKVVIPIESGSHDVNWEFTRDAGGSAGSDTCYVDQVKFTR